MKIYAFILHEGVHGLQIGIYSVDVSDSTTKSIKKLLENSSKHGRD